MLCLLFVAIGIKSSLVVAMLVKSCNVIAIPAKTVRCVRKPPHKGCIQAAGPQHPQQAQVPITDHIALLGTSNCAALVVRGSLHQCGALHMLPCCPCTAFIKALMSDKACCACIPAYMCIMHSVHHPHPHTYLSYPFLSKPNLS